MLPIVTGLTYYDNVKTMKTDVNLVIHTYNTFLEIIDVNSMTQKCNYTDFNFPIQNFILNSNETYLYVITYNFF